MDLSLESALSGQEPRQESPGRIAGRSLEEWNAAYSKVESYFHDYIGVDFSHGLCPACIKQLYPEY